jgi:DNA polymerase-1
MALLPGYKAQRPPMPEDLRGQIDGMVDYLKAAGIDSFCQDEIEADDYIGCLALKGSELGFFVVIASPDKDFMQLVSEQVCLLNPGDKNGELMGPDEVVRKTGVLPTQIVDWLSLIGDNADNIPGVAGVGPKTATKLLVTHGSIREVYDRLAELDSERLRSSLESAKEVARMNQELIRLKTELPCQFSEARFSRGTRDLPALRALCQSWGFRRMLAKLEEGGAQTRELAL